MNDKYKYIGRFRRIHQILRTEKERDIETGYDYFPPGRTYDSKLARWLQVDPLADKYPGWSPYNYALNNPIKFIDPNGMDVDEFGMERQGLEGEGKRVINRHRYLDDLGKDNSITGRYKNIYVKKFQPFYFSQISYTFPESDKPSPLEFIKGFSGTFFVSGYWEIDKLINGQWYVSLYAMTRSNIENDVKVDYWRILSLIKNNKEIENKPLEKDYNSLIPENWSHVGGNYFLLPEQGNIDLKLYVDYNITYPSGNANPIIKLSRTINIYSGKGQ